MSINFEPSGKALQYTQLLCGVALVYCLMSPAAWYWWSVVVIAYALNVVVGLSFTMHRLHSHKCFTMWQPLQRLLSVHACLSMVGSPISYAYIHRYHHANSDTEKDPHSPKHGIFGCVLGLHDEPNQAQTIIVRDFLKDNFQIMLHKYYLLVILGISLLVASVSMDLLLYGIMVPGFLSAAVSRLNNWVTHEVAFGSQDNDTGDNSRNVGWWNAVLCFSGEGWANNHHLTASKYDFRTKPEQIDITAWMIGMLDRVGVVQIKR